MRIIKPSVEIINQEEGLEGVYKQIETAGRTCYASTPIEGKAKDFVDRMIKSQHYAMLEHGTIYLYISHDAPITGYKYRDNKYSKYNEIRVTKNALVDKYITTNLRVLVENGWMDDLQYACEPTEYHARRVTFKFKTQVAITREMNRHRVNSVAEQSTRYCNYTKDKFGNEISISLPEFVKESGRFNDSIGESIFTEFFVMCDKVATGWDRDQFDVIDYWFFGIASADYVYTNLIRLGLKPENARTILPLCVNTEIIHTAFVSDWEHFLFLRAEDGTGKAHPDIKILALEIYKQLKNEGYINKTC